MTTAYFLDSSAAIKLYVVERGTTWITNLAAVAGRNEIFIVRLTVVEIAATLFRRVRGSKLSEEQAASAVSALYRDIEWTYQIVEFNPVLSDLALTMAERHGLRGYDCVQLAAAVTVQEDRGPAHLPSIALVSADWELNEAARAEGLQVVDPNDYP
ncbi:MAG: type II toxin-antitoxin system VapC family toxin [Dehalococcoidia bacterium]|nr:type II toxin-antitoxin system VapC family toxin [Dehalococcoidia bacterium]